MQDFLGFGVLIMEKEITPKEIVDTLKSEMGKDKVIVIHVLFIKMFGLYKYLS